MKPHIRVALNLTQPHSPQHISHYNLVSLLIIAFNGHHEFNEYSFLSHLLKIRFAKPVKKHRMLVSTRHFLNHASVLPSSHLPFG